MPLPGSRVNPVRLQTPEDLERATRHIARPSPGQASAGNYRKAHVNIGGLDVTIETPKEGMRRGVGPDGTPWSVQILADYGYVKRSEGADGDEVDVYLGPVSHMAEAFPVWVVDQCDADSREYDEHKCMLGFPSSEHARETYVGGFSDGRGHHRIGAVSRMSFADFRQWLKSEKTTEPLSYRKSASSAVISVPYGAATIYSFVGGFMTGAQADSNSQTAGNDPRSAGIFTKMLSSVMGRMTPEERTVMLQDAAALTTNELGKAGDMLSRANDMSNSRFIEDMWNDNPKDRLDVTRAHGPGSTASYGDVPVGPMQSASGNGGLKMEREYSRHAPQGGTTEAATILGREIAGMQGAMKSMQAAMTGVVTQVDVMKSALAAIPAAPTAESLQVMISEAISKAFEPMLAKAIAPLKAEITRALVKAEEEKDDKEDDEEAKHASSVLAKADDKDERDKEEDDDSEMSKSAAALRLTAKSRVEWARVRISKALDLATEGKAKGAQRQMTLAEANIAKAESILAKAVALRDAKVGPSTTAITADIAKAKKMRGDALADNQDIWPASTEGVGKGGATDPVAQTPAQTPPQAVDISKAVTKIEAALNGMGLIQASLSDMFKVVQGNTGQSGGGTALPPVFALAKSSPSDMASRETDLMKLRDNNIIDFDTYEKAQDALNRVRMGLPQDIVKAMVDRLPEPARVVLTRAA